MTASTRRLLISLPDLNAFRVNTPLLLDVLKEKNVKGTFFILGKSIYPTKDMAGLGPKNGHWEANRAILKRIVKEGHFVGIHGFNHDHWTMQTSEEWLEQVKFTGKLIEEIAGIKSWIIRAPGG
jgi:peptidoglycan/xylan/chitin deacetylase (PgdA/CDA1 family)